MGIAVANSEDEEAGEGCVLSAGPVSEAHLQDGLLRNFQWAFRLWRTLVQVMGMDALRARLFMRPLRFSSHFSGVGTLEATIGMLAAAGKAIVGQPLPFSAAFAVEVAQGCQHIHVQRFGGGCVFSNMWDHFGG